MTHAQVKSKKKPSKKQPDASGVCPTCGRGNLIVWQPNTYPPPQRTFVRQA